MAYQTVLERRRAPLVHVQESIHLAAEIEWVYVLDDVALTPDLEVDAIPVPTRPR